MDCFNSLSDPVHLAWRDLLVSVSLLRSPPEVNHSAGYTSIKLIPLSLISVNYLWEGLPQSDRVKLGHKGHLRPPCPQHFRWIRSLNRLERKNGVCKKIHLLLPTSLQTSYIMEQQSLYIYTFSKYSYVMIFREILKLIFQTARGNVLASRSKVRGWNRWIFFRT